MEQFTEPQNSYYDEGWKVGLPWLYYENFNADFISAPKKIKMRVSFGFENKDIGVIRNLTYVLAKYDFYGNFLGFENLQDQLQVCETSLEELEKLK